MEAGTDIKNKNPDSRGFAETKFNLKKNWFNLAFKKWILKIVNYLIGSLLRCIHCNGDDHTDQDSTYQHKYLLKPGTYPGIAYISKIKVLHVWHGCGVFTLQNSEKQAPDFNRK
ncbi:hypothetical protein [Ohtaekwangia sp.]|uniref:hypothetical protein n=1 Tax=Ohtaekwangia sp. TaxID=2066019 RepID=UPI002F958B03